MIQTFAALLADRADSFWSRRIAPLPWGNILFWSAVLMVALFGGLILGKGNITLDVLLFAAIVAVLTISLPLEWLFIALFVSTVIIAGTLQYFLDIRQILYIPPALAIVVGVKLFLIAALDSKRSRAGNRNPRQKRTILFAVYGYLLTIAISFAVNRPPAFQAIVAFKLYLPVWSVFFAIAFGFLSTEFVMRVWRWLGPLALFQTPFVLYQHFVVAASRPDAGTANSADSVVGTFGGNQTGGGIAQC